MKTMVIESLTLAEKRLIQAIRTSGIPITKLSNEICNVYRETPYYDSFAKAYKKIVEVENEKNESQS